MSLDSIAQAIPDKVTAQNVTEVKEITVVEFFERIDQQPATIDHTGEQHCELWLRH